MRFAAALIAVAAGSVIGPALAGALADLADLGTAFLLASTAPLAATLAFAGRAYPLRA